MPSIDLDSKLTGKRRRLQKGLEYVGIEEHINDDGSMREVRFIMMLMVSYYNFFQNT